MGKDEKKGSETSCCGLEKQLYSVSRRIFLCPGTEICGDIKSKLYTKRRKRLSQSRDQNLNRTTKAVASSLDECGTERGDDRDCEAWSSSLL